MKKLTMNSMRLSKIKRENTETKEEAEVASEAVAVEEAASIETVKTSIMKAIMKKVRKVMNIMNIMSIMIMMSTLKRERIEHQGEIDHSRSTLVKRRPSIRIKIIREKRRRRTSQYRRNQILS
jgi:PleD family two-component response regulator